MPEDISPIDPELQQLLNNKENGYKYRERREAEWTENYTLYRDKVTINRLTQRQSVNIPLMKQTIRTLLKDVDDMPVVFFENLDNDKEAEVFQNEYWKLTGEENRFELQDIVDKRQVFLFGRSFTQWQIVDGKVKMTVQDPIDILIDRYVDPTDLHSSRFLIHTHIYKPLSEIENDPMYDKVKVAELKKWYGTTMGVIKVASNAKMSQEKDKKLEDMGMTDLSNPILGEVIVELTLHFVYDKQKGSEEEELFLKVEADDQKILMRKPLEEIIGKTKDNFWRTHFPYDSWADDLERQDFWSDAIADIVRTPNKVLNAWFSQLVENRTLRNYNMNVYDSTVEGFNPNTFNPVPWGWYGVPGKPSELYQQMQVADLSESLDEMQFAIQLVEKATGATATQQGVQTERQVTLGEVQLALGEAKERVKGMSKFYTPAWKERGRLFLKLIEAASGQLEVVKIYKKGRNTSDIYQREIGPNDWETKSGYGVRVWSLNDKKDQDATALEKLNAAKINMPDNQKLDMIYKRKLVEFADLTPDEIRDIMDYEERKNTMLGNMGQAMGTGQINPMLQPGQGQPTPQLQLRQQPMGKVQNAR